MQLIEDARKALSGYFGLCLCEKQLPYSLGFN